MILAITFWIWSQAPIEMSKKVGVVILCLSLMLAGLTDISIIKLLLTL